MKRIIISGAIVATMTSANAANIIDGNPLYNPGQGHFYNILTPMQVNTNWDLFKITEQFGYGITDSVSLMIETSGSYDSSDHPEFGKWAWNDLAVGLNWELPKNGEQESEIYFRGEQMYRTKHNLETVAYNWTLGARMGRVTDKWTVAGVVELDYLNDDLPQNTFDSWAMTVGMQGQYIIDSSWNLVGGVMFDFDLFDKYYDGERLRVEFGVNYNLDATKYVGMYVAKDVVHSFEDAPMTLSLDFGIDF